MKSTAPIFKWTHHSYAVNANVVAAAITKIAKREGACQPQRLVETASDPASPLHPLFTWDNAQAAKNWRTHEARFVIGSIVEVHMTATGTRVQPAFVSVGHRETTQGAGGGYRPVSIVMADQGFTDEALSDALAQLQALRRRYESLKELAPIWQAIDEVTGEELAIEAA
jgi:hypothetical protein